ncbi:MAG: acyltransferase [Bacteroidia bacterium]|nr:acyltransferase [Bacteroidia bacterium]
MLLTENKRSAAIDGVRGIAVLTVFFSHTSGRGIHLHGILNFQGIGHVGVYLFFALSAYLLGKRLFTEGIDRKSVARFYIKRLLRIIPLYYTVLAGVFTYQLVTGNVALRYLHITNGFTGLFQHLIFYRGDGVFWSVVAEEQFYILVPLWVFLILRYTKYAVPLFAAAALLNFTLYLCHYTDFPFNTDAIRYLTTNDRESGNYIDIFIGALLLTYCSVRYKGWLERNSKLVSMVSSSLFVILYAATVILVSKQFLIFNEVFYKFRYLSLVFSLVFSLFIISVEHGNILNPLLSNRFLGKWGEYGFSVYLLHFGVFAVVNTLSLQPWLKFIVAFVFLFFVAKLSYFLIEKPSIRLSYKLIDRFGLK